MSDRGLFCPSPGAVNNMPNILKCLGCFFSLDSGTMQEMYASFTVILTDLFRVGRFIRNFRFFMFYQENHLQVVFKL